MTFRSGLLNAKNKLLIEGEVITKRLPILLRLIKRIPIVRLKFSDPSLRSGCLRQG